MANETHHAPNVDKSAAFTGLIVAVLFLLAVVVTIVKWTNSHYANEGAEKPAAAEAH